MIVTWLLSSFWGFVQYIVTHWFPDLLDSDIMTTIVQYVARIIRYGGSMFYLLIPETAFKTALDVLFGWAIHEPAINSVLWVLKKIPFLSIE